MMRQFRQWAQGVGRLKTSVGLDIGSSAVKIVQLERRGGRCRIRRFGWRGLEPDGGSGDPGRNPHRLKAALRDLIRELELVGSPVAMSVSGPSVMVKRIRLTGVKRNAIDEYLTWEGHNYIPYAMRDIYFDYWRLSPSRHEPASSDMDVVLVAAKQQVVDTRKALLEEAGVRPMVCDVDGLALMNMVMGKRRALRGQSFGVVNVGASGMNMVFVGREHPLLVRDVSFDETCAVRAVDAQSLPVAGDAVYGAPQDGAAGPCAPPSPEGVVREVRYCLESVTDRHPESRMQHMFLCGGHSKHESLRKALQHAVSIPVVVLNPFEDMDCMAQRVEPGRFEESAHLGGVALGLALRQDCHGGH